MSPALDELRWSPAPSTIAASLATARGRTLDLVSGLPEDALSRRLHPLMGPLVWDLGHIAAYEDLWLVHRHGERPMLRPDLAATYDAFETPRSARQSITLLDAAGAVDFLAQVRSRTLAVLEERGPHPVLHEMVLRHELQHTETMLQAMRLGGLPVPTPSAVDGTGLELLDVPAGPAVIGASDEHFAYDNERPRHVREVPAYRIGRTPVTNASWLSFAEGGGYVRREWWSDEGWAWKEEYDIHGHAEAVTGRPDAPVCHISWFEAEAFARAHDARLPSEIEWENAVTRPEGPLLRGTGEVWEWTANRFSGYPGFVAAPYREYSEIFFGAGHHTLRGGSCATPPRVKSPTLRNWDHPDRRQLFAGVRLAAEA